MRVYHSPSASGPRPERQTVKATLGGECIVAENYTAEERSISESCAADVPGRSVDIGRRYGFPPPGHTCSVTE